MKTLPPITRCVAPVALPPAAIQHAQQVPAQGTSVWSCGPNQAARVMALLDVPVAHYPDFLRACPRVCGPGPLIDEVARNSVATCLARTALRFTPIGPPPMALSRFAAAQLQQCGSPLSARACKLGAFADVLACLHRNLQTNRPVIALIGTGPWGWHYWTVVACDATRGEVQVLDTNQTVKRIPLARLEELMRFTPQKLAAMRWGRLLGLDTAAWVGDFNCIEFY